MPRADDVIRAYATFAPKNERLRSVGADMAKRPGATGVMSLDMEPGGMVAIALMGAPVPNGEADSAARFSFSAIATGWKPPPHKAHLIVTLTVFGAVSAIDSLSRFTSLLAA